jgi:hypothetical protein
MSVPNDPREPTDDQPVAGEPLIVPPIVEESGPAVVSETASPVVNGDVAPRVGRVESAKAPSGTSTVASPPPFSTDQTEPDGGGGSKAKTAAVLAGAVAVANKVRHEAPKMLQQMREKRAAGRCVIVTEADDRALAIGPYKNEDAARLDLFKVGGTSRVVELMSDTAFFAPHESPSDSSS